MRSPQMATLIGIVRVWMNSLDIKTIYRAFTDSRHALPLFLTRIAAGFPSPAEDYIEKVLDLNE